jgi:hypothetical protein
MRDELGLVLVVAGLRASLDAPLHVARTIRSRRLLVDIVARESAELAPSQPGRSVEQHGLVPGGMFLAHVREHLAHFVDREEVVPPLARLRRARRVARVGDPRRATLAAAVAIMLSTAWVFAQPHVNAAPWKAVVVVAASDERARAMTR